MDTKAKCRHLNDFTRKGALRHVFIRVYRLEIQSVSHVGIFDPDLLTFAPLTFTVWKGGGGWGHRREGGLRHINTCRKVCLQVNFFRWRHLAMVSISLTSPWEVTLEKIGRVPMSKVLINFFYVYLQNIYHSRETDFLPVNRRLLYQCRFLATRIFL